MEGRFERSIQGFEVREGQEDPRLAKETASVRLAKEFLQDGLLFVAAHQVSTGASIFGERYEHTLPRGPPRHSPCFLSSGCRS